MKSIKFKALLVVLLVFMMTLALAGCGNTSSKDGSKTGDSSNESTTSGQNSNNNKDSEPEVKSLDYTGKYYLISMETQGQVIEGELLTQAVESMGGIDEQYIDIIDEANFTMKFNGQTFDVKYTVDGETINWLDGGNPQVFTVADGVITWEVSDEEAGGNGFKIAFQKR